MWLSFDDADVFGFAMLILILFTDDMLCDAIVFPSIVDVVSVTVVAGSFGATVGEGSELVLESMQKLDFTKSSIRKQNTYQYYHFQW